MLKGLLIYLQTFSAAIKLRDFDVTKYNIYVIQMLVFDNSDKFSDWC
jgi:hypothetical protein